MVSVHNLLLSQPDLQPDPMLPQPYRIERVRRETHDIFTLELKPVNAASTMRFAPGQFNMRPVLSARSAAHWNAQRVVPQSDRQIHAPKYPALCWKPTDLR